MDKRLLDIVCCPVTHTPLRPLRRDELKRLNNALTDATVSIAKANGDTVSGKLSDGLVTTDGKTVYPIIDGIPSLLPEDGIATEQVSGLQAG